MCIRDRCKYRGVSKRERRNNVVVEWGQRANFPFVVYDDDLMNSQVLFLKGKSPVLVDELSCSLMLYNVVPSVRNNDIESMSWYCDERDVSREWYVTELYDLNRKYDKWKESLKIYVNNNDYNDLIKIINPIMSEFNDGELTKLPNVDWFHEYLSMMNEFSLYGYNTQNSHLCGDKSEQCYIKPRLICDDGG